MMSLIMTSVLLTACLTQSNDLEQRVRTLVDSRTNLYALLDTLRKDNSDDVIISALVPALQNDEGFKEHYARVRGFSTLLQLGTMTAEGKRVYTNPLQVQLMLDELSRNEPSSIQVQVIDALASVPEEQRPAFTTVLPAKLKKPLYWLVRSSLQALAVYGTDDASALNETGDLLVKPERANPGLFQALRESAPEEMGELVGKLRTEATRARIGLGALKDDLLLYPELDDQGQAAAARGILLQLGCDCSPNKKKPVASDEELAKALEFATEHFSKASNIRALPKESIGGLTRLSLPPNGELVKQAARKALEKFASIHPESAMRAMIIEHLQRLDDQEHR